MALTGSFSALVRNHIAKDAKFAKALLLGGIEALLHGELDVGKDILRDYIKATVGFEKLAVDIGAQPKSLIRMFGPRGNPQSRNLFTVIDYLQKMADVELHVVSRDRTNPRRIAAARKRQSDPGHVSGRGATTASRV